MIGLVLVSHSRAIALALKEMIGKLGAGRVPVAVAAGAGEGHTELGTDATAIMAAVEALGSADGVLVLLDLGSAMLSAEMALDLLDDVTRARVSLCAAPLVEGAIAAAAQASIGAPLAAVRAEAENALRQKVEHLGISPASPATASTQNCTAEAAGPETVVDMHIDNPQGLHARPAMRIVQAVAPLHCEVEIQNLRTGAPAASARSLVEINCLDAREGDTIRITARGEDAAEAIHAIETLHDQQFGDPPAAETNAATDADTAQAAGDSERLLHGRPLSDGIATGRLIVIDRAAPPLPPPSGVPDPKAELARLQTALVSVRRELARQASEAARKFGRENGAILQVQQVLAEDPGLVERASALIRHPTGPLPAAHAWQRACREAADNYRNSPSARLRERAQDLEDLAGHVLRALGLNTAPVSAWFERDEPAVFAVSTLLPSEVAGLDPRQIAGLIAESVGGTSHAAILLRAAGIPVVDGVPTEHLRPHHGTFVALNAGTGQIWIEPDAQQCAELENLRAAALGADPPGGGFETSAVPFHTQDGRRIELAANAASVAEARAAARAGAEGIGLLRTEFLFLERATPPAEDEQAAALGEIAAEFPPDAPITIRTLDIGGDKPVPFLRVPPEANPFLGIRGLRLTLQHPELFLAHLRAILRAGHGRRFRVMFPMVSSIHEIRRARTLLAQAHDQLTAVGQVHAWPVETGIMVEVPAAALLAHRLAAEVDFFSIGTNDLTQYTLAAERGHPGLTEFSDAMHPAVLRLVAAVTAAARRHGKWVGVCGESAADPATAAVFVGLGVVELSMGARALSGVRRRLAALDDKLAREVARQCLRMESAISARALVL